jgi:hypothetical protein
MSLKMLFTQCVCQQAGAVDDLAGVDIDIFLLTLPQRRVGRQFE